MILKIFFQNLHREIPGIDEKIYSLWEPFFQKVESLLWEIFPKRNLGVNRETYWFLKVFLPKIIYLF